MSANEAVDISLSNVACRILTVSTSLSQATTLINRVRVLANAPSKSTSESTLTAATTITETTTDLLSPGLVKIPWTITNKYYSADIHFAAHTIHGLAPYLLQNVPAVIFVWCHGEAYKHHIRRLSQDLAGHEPEVSLAVKVRLDGSPVDPVENDEMNEDNVAVDGFLSSHGFEYIDATQEVLNRHRRSRSYDEGDTESIDGIPNLPRVLDALSTIMWPSMKPVAAKQGKGQKQGDLSLLGSETTDSFDTSSLVNDLVTNSSRQLSARADRMQKEMDELAKWLEEDKDDPWSMAASSHSFTPPTEDNDVVSTKQGNSSPTSAKFDDDFTAFVSAPPIHEEEHRFTDLPAATGGRIDDTDQQPATRSEFYSSLDSFSDFGESEEGNIDSPDGWNVISDNEDEDENELPTQQEILETSYNIFGKRTGGSYRPATEDELRNAAEGDDYDMAPFDLSRVVGALQHMKEEIAGMEDEEERRRAAARVALGLVYGLEVEGHFDGGVGR